MSTERQLKEAADDAYWGEGGGLSSAKLTPIQPIPPKAQGGFVDSTLKKYSGPTVEESMYH